MKHAAIALSLLLPLSACGSGPIPLKPFQVDVRVPVPCHQEIPPAPAWMMTAMAPDSDIADQVKAALIEINQREAYEDDLKAQILACK